MSLLPSSNQLHPELLFSNCTATAVVAFAEENQTSHPSIGNSVQRDEAADGTLGI